MKVFTGSQFPLQFYFSVYFDKLGMTSADHIWPLRMPPFYPFGDLMVRKEDKKEDKDKEDKISEDVREAAAAINNLRNRNRRERSIMSLPPPENMHGGERAIMFPRIENLLGTVGMEGRGCLLRAICEVHEYPLERGYGFFGEIVTLFFR